MTEPSPDQPNPNPCEEVAASYNECRYGDRHPPLQETPVVYCPGGPGGEFGPPIPCPCGCGSMMLMPTVAERLLLLAELTIHPKGKIVWVDQDMDGTLLARVRLAMELSKKPRCFQFRAMAEGWSAQRLIREMY